MTERAFCETAKENQRLLYHVAYTILHNNHECEDAIQETLLKAWQKQGTLRNEEYFKCWLVKILTNVCKGMLRKRQYMEPLPSNLEGADVPENQELHDALARLPEDLRFAMVLHYLEGFSTKEIAHIISRPEGTVRNRLFRGRQQLKEWMKEEIE